MIVKTHFIVIFFISLIVYLGKEWYSACSEDERCSRRWNQELYIAEQTIKTNWSRDINKMRDCISGNHPFPSAAGCWVEGLFDSYTGLLTGISDSIQRSLDDLREIKQELNAFKVEHWKDEKRVEPLSQDSKHDSTLSPEDAIILQSARLDSVKELYLNDHDLLKYVVFPPGILESYSQAISKTINYMCDYSVQPNVKKEDGEPRKANNIPPFSPENIKDILSEHTVLVQESKAFDIARHEKCLNSFSQRQMMILLKQIDLLKECYLYGGDYKTCYHFIEREYFPYFMLELLSENTTELIDEKTKKTQDTLNIEVEEILEE